MVQPENRREPPESGPIGTQSIMNSIQEQADRQQAVRPNQWDQLLSSDQESDCVHEPKKPEENEAGDLVGRLAAFSLGGLGFCFHDQSILRQLESGIQTRVSSLAATESALWHLLCNLRPCRGRLSRAEG